MLASNLVYATLFDMYPRLLADDGVHEPLVLPPDADSYLSFVFYNERGQRVDEQIFSAEYIPPAGGIPVALTFSANTVRFPATLEAGGVVLIRLTNNFACYPFRLLRAGG